MKNYYMLHWRDTDGELFTRESHCIDLPEVIFEDYKTARAVCDKLNAKNGFGERIGVKSVKAYISLGEYEADAREELKQKTLARLTLEQRQALGF